MNEIQSPTWDIAFAQTAQRYAKKYNLSKENSVMGMLALNAFPGVGDRLILKHEDGTIPFAVERIDFDVSRNPTVVIVVLALVDDYGYLE